MLNKQTSSYKEPRSRGCPVYTKHPRIMCKLLNPVFWDCRYDSECKNRKQKCCRKGPCGTTTCMNPVRKFYLF